MSDHATVSSIEKHLNKSFSQNGSKDFIKVVQVLQFLSSKEFESIPKRYWVYLDSDNSDRFVTEIT